MKLKSRGKSKEKKRREPYEFFQKVVLISWAIMAVWISASYVLAYLERNVNEAVTLALVAESFGVSLSYAIYQATLKTSLNKNGLTVGRDKEVRRVEEVMNDESNSI